MEETNVHIHLAHRLLINTSSALLCIKMMADHELNPHQFVIICDHRGVNNMDDQSAMSHIANILDGREWDSSVPSEIAHIVQATGRNIRSRDEEVIRVYVEGGAVHDVDGIPPGVTVVILDTDKDVIPNLSRQEYITEEK